MKIEINLQTATFVKMPVVLLAAEEKIEISFASSVYRLTCLAGEARCGDKVKKFVTRGEAVDITDLCVAGELNITVSLVGGDEKLKTWRLEPLLLKEIDGELRAIPAIEDMKTELAVLRYDLGTVKSALAELTALVKDNSI